MSNGLESEGRTGIILCLRGGEERTYMQSENPDTSQEGLEEENLFRKWLAKARRGQSVDCKDMSERKFWNTARSV